MTDIVALMADVLATHECTYGEDGGFCCTAAECDWTGQGGDFYTHVAQVLTAELKLTDEWSDDIAGPDWGRHHRWVTPRTFYPGPGRLASDKRLEEKYGV